MILPAISLWQPWASLIFTGDKVHETRAYPPPAKYVGKRIAIHAAKLVVPLPSLALELLCEREFGGEAGYRQLPRGAIIGTVTLAERIPAEAVKPGITDGYCGNFTPGRWAWRLADPQALPEPVPWKGKQGWFQVDLP